MTVNCRYPPADESWETYAKGPVPISTSFAGKPLGVYPVGSGMARLFGTEGPKMYMGMMGRLPIRRISLTENILEPVDDLSIEKDYK